jgi:hypothetical protein
LDFYKIKGVLFKLHLGYLYNHNSKGCGALSINAFAVCKNAGDTVGQPWLMQMVAGKTVWLGTHGWACNTTKRW